MRATKPIVLAALVAGFFVAIGTFQAKSSPSYLQMTIVNGTNYGLTGDGQKTDNYGNSIYIDHDLTNGDPCVTAALNNGYIAVQQNYVLSIHPKQGWCNAQPGVTHPRYWNIVINDKVVCQTVFGVSYSAPSCTFNITDMTSTDYEGVVPGDIFTSTSSQINMVFTLDDRTTGYGVRTDGTATITGTGNSRTVTYTGTAQLNRQGQPTGTGSFNFPFQLIFEEL
jgi:hypothetical protein